MERYLFARFDKPVSYGAGKDKKTNSPMERYTFHGMLSVIESYPSHYWLLKRWEAPPELRGKEIVVTYRIPQERGTFYTSVTRALVGNDLHIDRYHHGPIYCGLDALRKVADDIHEAYKNKNIQGEIIEWEAPVVIVKPKFKVDARKEV